MIVIFTFPTFIFLTKYHDIIRLLAAVIIIEGTIPFILNKYINGNETSIAKKGDNNHIQFIQNSKLANLASLLVDNNGRNINLI